MSLIQEKFKRSVDNDQTINYGIGNRKEKKKPFRVNSRTHLELEKDLTIVSRPPIRRTPDPNTSTRFSRRDTR